MQHLETLWKVVNVAANVRDLAVDRKTYRYMTEPPFTCYLHTRAANVTVSRWQESALEIDAQFQAGFGWRVKDDQDEAGVYFVARRRAVVGGIGTAQFRLRIPSGCHLVLRLEHCSLQIEQAHGTYYIPADATNQPITLPAGLPPLPSTDDPQQI